MFSCCFFFAVFLKSPSLSAEVLGSTPELAVRIRAGALLDVVTSTEEQASKAKEALCKLRSILVEFHETLFPSDDVPSTLDALVSVFLNTSVLVEFSREQTLSGAETVLTLARAHGIDGDFEKAFRGPPKDSSGRDVNLKPFAADSQKLAQQLLEMLEARAQAAEEARRKAVEEGTRRQAT